MKNTEGKNVREKVFYDFSVIENAQKIYRGFIKPDTSDGIVSNWKGSDGRLSDGHAMEISKVGFFLRPAAGKNVVNLSDLAIISRGTYSIKKGEDELKSGTLSEFMPAFLANGAAIIASEQEFSTALLPLLQPEVWGNEPIDFTINIPAGVTANSVEIAPVIKGVYES